MPHLTPAAQAAPPHPCHAAPSFRDMVPHPGPHCLPSLGLLMPSHLWAWLAYPGVFSGVGGIRPEAPLPEGSPPESQSGVSCEAGSWCLSPRLGPDQLCVWRCGGQNPPRAVAEPHPWLACGHRSGILGSFPVWGLLDSEAPPDAGRSCFQCGGRMAECQDDTPPPPASQRLPELY